MDRLGHELFPGPIFTGNEDIDGTFLDLVDQSNEILHARAGAQKIFGGKPGTHFFPKLSIFPVQLPMVFEEFVEALGIIQGEGALFGNGHGHVLIFPRKGPIFFIECFEYTNEFAIRRLQGYG